MLKLTIFHQRRWDREIVRRMGSIGKAVGVKGENVGEILLSKRTWRQTDGGEEKKCKNYKKKEQAEGKPVFRFGLAEILLIYLLSILPRRSYVH